MNNYKNKYLKYKEKYLNTKSNDLTNMNGGSKTKCKKIIFVRHGESTENVATKKGIEYDAENIVLTDNGIEQAKKTGEYLSKVYGKFDKVYSSPATRCVQTSNIIMEQISYPIEKIIIEDLVVEAGYFNHKASGMDKDFIDKFYKKNKKLIKLDQKMSKTSDPYERLDLLKKYNRECEKYFEVKPSLEEVYDNYTKFLDKLKDLSDEKILVVGHFGTLENMVKIICNVDIDNIPVIGLVEVKPYSNKQIELSKSKIYGNCSIMCLTYCENKFQIVSSPNTYHLD